jgi:dolichol kinase
VKQEFLRKLFHLSGLVYLVLYACLPWAPCVFLLAMLGLFFGFGEYLRLRHAGFDAWCLRCFGRILRDHERRAVTGVFWTWLGAFSAILLFKEAHLVYPALGFLIFGDTAAALIGRAWGRHSWPGKPGKSFEGSAAFWVVSALWAGFFVAWPFAILSAAVAAYVETVDLPLNDNLWIPLAGGGSLWLFQGIQTVLTNG